ncbi:MAG: hypothetical protein ACO29O_06030 [Chitinophagaceae bacterium]
MKFASLYILIIFLLQFTGSASAQKLLSEGYILYDVVVESINEPQQTVVSLQGTTAISYVKGNLSRTELKSNLGNSIVIHDSRNGNTVMLREFGAQKILIRLNTKDWSERNRKYEGIVFTPTGEKKIIEGYNCIQAKATLLDGSHFLVYYTTELNIENKEMDPMFSDLPGVALEFDSLLGSVNVKYTVKRISFDPVPIQKFDIPTSGYRELSYQESIKMNH